MKSLQTFYNYFNCVPMSGYMYICAGAHGGQKRTSEPPELELVTGNCELTNVGSGNQTCFFWKNS